MKKIIKIFCIFCTITSIAHASGKFIGTFGVGSSLNPPTPEQQVIISPWVDNYLHPLQHKKQPSFFLGFKKILDQPTNSFISSLHVGPAAYFDSYTSIGDVWELNLPQFNNYTYQLSIRHIDLLAEADAYLSPIGQWLTPFLTVGLGASIYGFDYNDWANSGIPQDGELHLNSHRRINLAYSIGAGLNYTLTQKIGIFIKYRFQDAGLFQSELAPNLLVPIRVHAVSNQLFLGVQYRA